MQKQFHRLNVDWQLLMSNTRTGKAVLRSLAAMFGNDYRHFW